MKRIQFHILIAALPAMLFALSCNRMAEQDAAEASAITFSAATGYEPGTRTAFSGEVSGDSRTYERIDWVNGDCIRICSAEAETAGGAHAADYAVTASSADGFRSLAAVKSDDPLLWGAGTNTFYALYPAPGSDGADPELSLSVGTVEAVIPATQTVTASETVWKPDMHYAYMVAAARAVSTDVAGPVSLVFSPLVNTFEINLLNFTTDPVESDLQVVRLRSTADGARLSGGFTATLEADGSFSAAPAGEGSDAVSVTFPSGTRLSTSKALTVTLFTIPVALSCIQLELEFASGLIRKLPLADGGTPITVPAGEKIYLDNLTVPDGWAYHIETTTPAVVTTQSGGTTTFTVRSYRTKKGVTEDVVWNAVFSASEDGPFTDTPPEGFELDAVTGDGSSVTVEATVGSQTGTDQVVDLTIPHKERFAALSSSPRGSLSQPFDLSMYNLVADATRTANEPVTANCYVVDRAGWYMFPLVYGNAIDYTKVSDNNTSQGGNAVAYMPTASGDDYFITPFQNAKGDGIVSPYILDDLSACGFVSAETLANHYLDAVIVWQDVEAGKELVTHPQILWSKPVAANAESGLACPYVCFEAFENAANYAQGNAVIAIRDISAAADKTNVLPSEATILWSWHIWLTDEPLAAGLKKTVNKIGSMGYNWMMPVNIGYCDPDIRYETVYPARDCWVRISQPGSDVSAVLRVRQEEVVIRTTKAGSNPYYQMGRKDPILPAAGTSDGQNKVYVSGAGYTFTDDDRTVVTKSVGTASALYSSIRYPYMMVYSAGSGKWVNAINLWNATNSFLSYSATTSNNSAERSVVKTVYDPCPPGFSLPSKCAFTFFTVDGTRATSKAGMNLARQDWEDGFWFCCENDEGGIFFPATGIRGDYLSSTSPYSLDAHVTGVKSSSQLWVPVLYRNYDAFFGDFYSANYGSGSLQLTGFQETCEGNSVRAVVEEHLKAGVSVGE